jgi:hypothetical protein
MKKDNNKVLEGKITRKRFVAYKTKTFNRRLAIIFATETEEVRTHTMRKLHAHMAFIPHADEDSDEFEYVFGLLAHDNESVHSVLAYLCVRLDDPSPIR